MPAVPRRLHDSEHTQTCTSHRLTNRTELPAPNSATATQVKALYLHCAHKNHSSLDVSCLTCLVMNVTLVLAWDFAALGFSALAVHNSLWHDPLSATAADEFENFKSRKKNLALQKATVAWHLHTSQTTDTWNLHPHKNKTYTETELQTQLCVHRATGFLLAVKKYNSITSEIGEHILVGSWKQHTTLFYLIELAFDSLINSTPVLGNVFTKMKYTLTIFKIFH